MSIQSNDQGVVTACNLAIQYSGLGYNDISSLEDNTEEASILKKVFFLEYKKMLATNSWEFSKRRADLEISEEQSELYDKPAFILPNDFLAKRGLYYYQTLTPRMDLQEFVRIQTVGLLSILTINRKSGYINQLGISYTALVSPLYMDDQLVSQLAYRLAMALCLTAKDLQMHAFLKKELATAINESYMIDYKNRGSNRLTVAKTPLGYARSRAGFPTTF